MKDRLCEKGYEILNIVGKGSFSTVYRLREMKTGRHCACKVSENQKMLFREAELLRRLEHPLFPVFYDFWQQEKEACLVMEYIASTCLEKLVGDRGRLTDRRASIIGLELASGLAYLHELPIPILHRDITPGNILIRQDGRVKLLDLGCACAVGEKGIRAGTPGFADPRQPKGSRACEAGDIYAFGKILQFMRGGRLCRLAEACIRQQPGDRPGNMRICLYALMDCMEKETEKNITGIIFGRKEKEICRNAKAVWKKSQ